MLFRTATYNTANFDDATVITVCRNRSGVVARMYDPFQEEFSEHGPIIDIVALARQRKVRSPEPLGIIVIDEEHHWPSSLPALT
jgi:hypothetical protein